jgi:uncharacterized protein
MCGAVKTMGLVVAPSGDLHKCWDTISLPEMRVGTIFDVAAGNDDPRLKEWARWSPFDNAACVECRLLPACAGSCAHKFINVDQTSGEAAAVPCPSWKSAIKERIVWAAEHSGAISRGDYDPEEIKTRPTDVCLGPPRVPVAVPAVRAKVRLPVLSDAQFGGGAP